MPEIPLVELNLLELELDIVALTNGRLHFDNLVVEGCCQTNSNQSQFAAETANLSGTKLTPLAKSGGAGQLEGVSAGERSFLVEVVVNGGVDGGEFL